MDEPERTKKDYIKNYREPVEEMMTIEEAINLAMRDLEEKAAQNQASKDS